MGIRLFVAVLMLLSACTPASKSEVGFRLPDGDADKGRVAFTDLRCNGCHGVSGLEIEFAGLDPAQPVPLGGEVTRVKSYGELVTAIINPSHKLTPHLTNPARVIEGESIMAMARLNETMTVQQLIDLVAFLQPQYQVRPPDTYPYSYRYGE